MKRVLFSLCLIALSAPAWPQDEDGTRQSGEESAPATPRMTREAFCDMAPEGTEGCSAEQLATLQTGPSESAIEDLLNLLDSDSCEGDECDTPASDADSEDTPEDATDTGTEEDAGATDTAAEEDTDAADAGSEEDTTREEPAGSDTASVDAAAETEIPGDAGTENETATEEAAPPHQVTHSAPFLSSDVYASLRQHEETGVLQLIWQVETFTPDGLRAGEPSTRTIYLAPGYVRDENGNAVSIYDFAHNRHLSIDLAAASMVNNAFEAEVRRRTDTYLGLSQAGRLEQIPLGPDRSFDRFWLEAAMGIRREPVEMQAAFARGELTVTRGMGPSLLSASFGEPDDEDTGETETSDDEADPADEAEATEDEAMDDILAMATPIDLSSGESVVFNPSQAAAPITLDTSPSTPDFPDSTPEEQARAELFRRWMRHALPLHPDVLANLRGAPSIPQQFSYFVISPDSPDGRREVWTLQSSEAVEDGFRLEEGLTARASAPALLSDIVLPVAAAASAAETAPGEDAFIEAIAAYREAGDLARAYLVTFQETSRNGPCPASGQDDSRIVCAEVAGLVAAGLGDESFEALFAAISQIGGENAELLLETLSPYLEEDSLAGAAARTIIANELLAWAVRDPEGPPEDLNPNILLAESIAIDPFAGANYRYLGNSLLTLRNPVGAWTVFDAGRAVAGPATHPMLLAVGVQEERLHGLAPDFFLPR